MPCTVPDGCNRQSLMEQRSFWGISRLFFLITAVPKCHQTFILDKRLSMVSATLKKSLRTGLIFNGNEAARQYLNSLICTVLYNLLAKIQDFSRTTFRFYFQPSSFWMVGKNNQRCRFVNFRWRSNAATEFYLAISRRFIFATVLSKYNLTVVLTV